MSDRDRFRHFFDGLQYARFPAMYFNSIWDGRGLISQNEGAHSDYDNTVEGNDVEDNGAFGALQGDGEAGAS